MKLVATSDRAVALVLLLFFGGLFALSLQLGYWDGFAPSSGFAPLWIAVCGISLAIALLLSKPDEGRVPEPHDRGGPTRVAQAVAGLVAFVALTPVLGMVPAGFLLMLALLLLVLRRPWPASLFTAAVSAALVYAIFVAWLGVPLPKGLFGF